ncbi:hypothetical protein MMC21_002472 [Puttea exsequens]|nr:hypothetical protein [Puttea exsequens]
MDDDSPSLRASQSLKRKASTENINFTPPKTPKIPRNTAPYTQHRSQFIALDTAYSSAALFQQQRALQTAGRTQNLQNPAQDALHTTHQAPPINDAHSPDLTNHHLDPNSGFIRIKPHHYFNPNLFVIKHNSNYFTITEARTLLSIRLFTLISSEDIAADIVRYGRGPPYWDDLLCCQGLVEAIVGDRNFGWYEWWVLRPVVAECKYWKWFVAGCVTRWCEGRGMARRSTRLG